MCLGIKKSVIQNIENETKLNVVLILIKIVY